MLAVFACVCFIGGAATTLLILYYLEDYLK